MKKHQLRKKKYCDPEVQGALTKRLTLHWILYIGITAMLVVGLKWLNNPFTPLSDQLADAWVTYGAVLVVLLSLAPMFVFDMVKLSNRFAGPVLRIRNTARQLADGEIPQKIKLRDGDFWTDLADEFNRVIERVEAQAKSNETLASSTSASDVNTEEEAVCEPVGGGVA